VPEASIALRVTDPALAAIQLTDIVRAEGRLRGALERVRLGTSGL
jgi:hypothetical protein